MSFSMPRKIEFTEKSSDLLENSSIKTESDMLVPVYDYSIPAWGYVPDIKLSIEIIKSGVTIGNIIWPKNKSFMIFGRMESCDLILDHSSVSRFHAILQYSTEGKMYIYDLESHHGTFLNKMKIPSLHYISVPSESIVKFGESTRIYAIHGEIKEGLHNCMSEKNTFTEKINHEKNADVTNYVEIIKTFLIENDEQLKFKIVENVNGSNMRLEISADICGSQSNLIFEVKYAGNKISENLVCKKAYERLSELGIIYDKSGLETNWKVWKKQREEDTIIESDVYFDECLTKSYIKNEMETLSDLEKNPSLELLVSEKNSLVLEKEHLTNLTEEPSEYMDEYDIYFKNINTEMRSHRIIQIQNRLAVINNLIEDMQKTDLISHK